MGPLGEDKPSPSFESRFSPHARFSARLQGSPCFDELLFQKCGMTHVKTLARSVATSSQNKRMRILGFFYITLAYTADYFTMMVAFIDGWILQ